MRALSRTLCLLAASILVSYGSASAAPTLRTPLIIASSFVACVATNIGTKPLDVTVSVTDAAGAPLAASTDTCTGTPVPPQSSCLIQVTTFSAAIPIGGFCSFTGSGKYKAVGYGTSGSTAVAFPAAK